MHVRVVSVTKFYPIIEDISSTLTSVLNVMDFGAATTSVLEDKADDTDPIPIPDVLIKLLVDDTFIAQ